MITVAEAYQIILDQNPDFGTEQILSTNALDRILEEDIFSDRDLPPFDRVCMDGIAIHSKSYQSGRREYIINDMQAAGMPKKTLQNRDHCLEVATGATLPDNTDTIVPYESLQISNGVARIAEEIKLRANIHEQATDKKKGDLLIQKNKKISFPEIGALASVGKVTVKVSRIPRVLILSTGDELVNVEEFPENHQIRKSNVHVLQNILKSYGIPSDIDHIRDDAKNIILRFEKYFNTYEVLILSGAVSRVNMILSRRLLKK